MGIISDSLGAAFGLGSSIYGGIRGAKERKKQEKLLNQQIQENKDLFKREYYQDIMNRSDTANILKNYRDTLKRQGKTQRNIATVTGATPEAVAAQKKINADAYGDVISNISSQSSRLKDNALNRYEQLPVGAEVEYVRPAGSKLLEPGGKRSRVAYLFPPEYRELHGQIHR